MEPRNTSCANGAPTTGKTPSKGQRPDIISTTMKMMMTMIETINLGGLRDCSIA